MQLCLIHLKKGLANADEVANDNFQSAQLRSITITFVLGFSYNEEVFFSDDDLTGVC